MIDALPDLGREVRAWILAVLLYDDDLALLWPIIRNLIADHLSPVLSYHP